MFVVRLQVLGDFRLFTNNSNEVQITSRKGKAIFAIMALAPDNLVSRKTLKSLLWSRLSDADASAQCRNAIFRLRQSLTSAGLELLVSSRTSLMLDTQVVQRSFIDVHNESLSFGLTPQSTDFLTDLTGLDPAFDQWLANARVSLFRSWSKEVLTKTVQTQHSKTLSMKIRRATTIGICPFRSMATELDDNVTIAIAEEIANALSTHSRLTVISVGSVATSLASGSRPGLALGLDFLLEGVLQPDGKEMVLSIKLIEAESGVISWTERLRFDTSNLFSIQRLVASQLIARLETRLPNLEIARMDRSGPAKDETYRLVLHAMVCIYRLDRSTFTEAGSLLRMAIAIEPEYAAPHAWLALWLVLNVGQGWTQTPERDILEADQMAARAIDLDPEDARALAVAGHIQAYFFGDIGSAVALHERALAANPSLTLAWHLSAMAYAYVGDLAEAERRLEACWVLAPDDPNGWFADGARVLVTMLAGRYQAAIEIGRRVTRFHPNFISAYKGYLAALGHAGLLSEAQLVYSKLTSLEPGFSIERFKERIPYKCQEHVERFVSGLLLAGVT